MSRTSVSLSSTNAAKHDVPMKQTRTRSWRTRVFERHSQALDEALVPGSVRIVVAEWRPLWSVDGLYFRRPAAPRFLARSLRELGIGHFLRKVRSRRAETARNEKWLVVGSGMVQESRGRTPHHALVTFVAPRHPTGTDLVVLDERLISVVPGDCSNSPDDALGALPHHVRAALTMVEGWSPFSGAELDQTQLTGVHDWLQSSVRRCGPANVTVRELSSPPRVKRDRRLSAVLFGYGNYAKTIILPVADRHLRIDRIHELDPAQIDVRAMRRWGFDTMPALRDNENPDVVIIAGFHHHHAPLAAASMARGATAIIEKPTATTPHDIEMLRRSIRQGGRAFACFQRRYAGLERFLARDLAWHTGEPIDYHCIVYEEPLPARHWYRWPASRTRLASNGCHWVDHFLNLNAYSAVASMDVWQGKEGVISASLELENSATFTMTLTDRGDWSRGLRDHIEVRTHNGTATVVNSQIYTAISPIIRTRVERFRRLDFHEAMYRDILRATTDGLPCDTEAELLAAAEVVVQLEARLATAG